MTSSISILTKRREFLACAASGRKFVRPTLVMQTRKRAPEDEPYAAKEAVRIGFTCTKTLGGAVIRNRVKRRLRAAAAKVLPEQAKPGQDYVLIGRLDWRCAALMRKSSLTDMAMAVARLG